MFTTQKLYCLMSFWLASQSDFEQEICTAMVSRGYGGKVTFMHTVCCGHIWQAKGLCVCMYAHLCGYAFTVGLRVSELHGRDWKCAMTTNKIRICKEEKQNFLTTSKKLHTQTGKYTHKLDYSLTLKTGEDLKRWRFVPASVPAQISVIKMHMLSRVLLTQWSHWLLQQDSGKS